MKLDSADGAPAGGSGERGLGREAEQQLVADIFLHKATIDFPIARCARRSRL